MSTSIDTPQGDTPQGVRIRHSDGSSTPVELQFMGRRPQQTRNGDIRIIDVWQVTTVVSWAPGDRFEADMVPGSCSIGFHRVGVK